MAAFVLSIFSCTDSDTYRSSSEDRTAIRVSAGFTNNTRASDSSWEEQDAIGITMVQPGTSTVVEEYSHRHYVTSNGQGDFAPATDVATIYFPHDGSQVGFKAYYPYLSTLESDMIYPVNVSNQNALAQIDLMTADHLAGTSKEDPDVELQFYHRLSKLIFNLTAEDGISLDNSVLTIKGMHTEATYDLNVDDRDQAVHTVDQSSQADVTVPLRTSNGVRTGTGILLPRSASTGVTFEVTTPDGGQYIAIMDESLDLDRGYKYIFNINLKRTPVTVSATIEDWIEGTEVYEDVLNVSVSAGDSYGISVGDTLNVYLKDGTNYTLLEKFGYQADGKWYPRSPVYWEDIADNPATLRATLTPAEGLNGTQLPDILISEDTSVARNTGANFELYHATSKVIVRLTSSTFDADALNSAEIVLPNYLTGAYEENGQLVLGSDRVNVAVDRTDPQNGIALIQPQSIGVGETVARVTISGRTYNATASNAVEFMAGVATLLTLNIEMAEMTVSARVVDWDENELALDAITIGVATSGAEGVLDGEQLNVYTGDADARALMNTYIYNAANDTFGAVTPTYWESLADPTTFYASITRHAAYNSTQLPDYLVAQPTTVAASNGITFTLSHAAAQVVVRLSSSDGTFSTDELNAATLTLPDYLTGGTMDNGLFVPGTTQSAVEFAKNVGENNNSTIALIQPQTIAAGDELVRIVAGAANPRTYNVRYDQAVEFQAGVTTYLDIDMKKSAVTLSAQVLDWEDGQTIDFVLQAITVGGTLEGTDDFFQDQSIRIYKLGTSPEVSDYSYTLQNGVYTWSQGTIFWDDQDPATMNLGAAYTLGLQGLPQSIAANVTTFPWAVPVDQSAGYNVYDLYLSHLYLSTPTVANFVFTPVLSKVRVKLEAGTGFEAAELAGATVSLNNMYLSGTADLSAAQVTYTGAKSATITPYTETAGEVYSALVMPQVLSATDVIVTVTLPGYPGETFTGILSAGLTLQAGKEHVIRVTLNKTGISLYATVEDWSTGDSGNVIID